MAVQFVALGHVLCETIVYADGHRKGPVLGSPAAYTSAVAARLGVAAGIVTKLGSDAPSALLQPLRDACVDLEGVDTSTSTTTTNHLIYAPDGTKELKYVKQAASITFADLPQSYHSAAVFHVCPLDYEVSTLTISRIASLGGIVGLDLGGFGGAHVNKRTNDQKKLPLPALRDLIGSCTVAKASDEDARLLFPDGSYSEQEVARQFVNWGARVGIVTLGPRGSFVATEKNQHHVGALTGEIVDVTGGGDSYIAGFLVEYKRTGDPKRAALFGTAVASYVISRTGGVLAERMPTEAAVVELMSGNLENQRI